MATVGEAGVHFFTETPGLHFSEEVQRFIDQEIYKPNKIWAKQIVESEREVDSVKLRTDEFVLLPDLVAYRRQYKQGDLKQGSSSLQYYQPRKRSPIQESGSQSKQCGRQCKFQQHSSLCMSGLDLSEFQTPARHLNWLAIVADPSIRTIRDLTADHVPMLERLHELCMNVITEETGLERQDVMVFANYPPSVYKLHFHFCAPFFKSSAYDGFRIHPLSTIINNLKLFPDYYKLSTFDVPLHANSDLCKIIQLKSKQNGTVTAMRFHMETFVLLDFFRMNKSEPEYPDEVISDECVKFYVFRALELFERSRGIFSNPDRISIHERAKLVAVCLRLVFNLYRSRTWGYDTFYVYLGRMFLLPKVKRFEEQFKKMEWDACNAMGFTLMPGVARDHNDMVYKGSQGALMTETVEYHIKNLKMLNAVSNLAVSYQCEHFLFKKTEAVPEELKSIHKGILKLAKQDNFFSMSLRNLFVTDGKAVEDTYLDLNWACKAEMRPEAVQRILEQMVSETMDARRTDYTLILASMTALRDTVMENPKGFRRERFDYIRNEIAHNTALQLIAEKELDVIGLIHEGSVKECRNILKSVDDMGTEALEKIKVSGRSARGCRKEVQKVSDVKSKGSARGEFTRVELGSCTILTRVSSDPFKTPMAGVNHRVTCIPGPRRNLVKKVYKYSEDKESPPELVRVEVSQTYSKACELMAAAYSARCNAADSASLAASEQAILDITPAEDCIDWAAAASAAAAAANAAARAAEAADAAAAAAWSALEMEIESELASDAGGK